MRTLEKSEKVLNGKRMRALHHELDDCVEAINEILLLDIKSGPGANLNNLESTKKRGYNILKLLVVVFVVHSSIGF